MNKQNITIVGLIIVLFAVGGLYFKQTKTNLGNLNVNENAYRSGVAYSTSSILGNVATSLILKATSSRTYAEVCVVTGNRIWIYKQATSTGIATGMGYPLYSTTTATGFEYEPCFKVDASDPYLGEIWAIAETTSTVTVDYLQN